MKEEEALKKALDRERARRSSAELLLEERSRELFESFEQLTEAHAALKKNQKQLARAETMASLGIMSAGVAHEISNPVGFALSNVRSMASSMGVLEKAINESSALLKESEGNAELTSKITALEKELNDADLPYLLEDMPCLLEETEDGLKRIRDIVDDLRFFAQEDVSIREQLDLNQSVRTALSDVGPKIGSDVQIMEKYGDLPMISASKPGLAQVFLNVIRNGCEALEGLEAPRQTLTIETTATEEGVCASFIDTGCGMNTEQHKNMFTPFYTTKEVGQGTGLGLSISIGIIQDHGGHIDVTSTEGEGTRLDVRLPLEPAA